MVFKYRKTIIFTTPPFAGLIRIWAHDHICTRFGGTYTKIGTIQRRLAWPLRKDDTQIREAFHIFSFPE